MATRITQSLLKTIAVLRTSWRSNENERNRGRRRCTAKPVNDPECLIETWGERMSAYRILLVDDEPTIHEILFEYLRFAGYKLISALDGPSALVAVRKETPALVLLDVQMPEMDGFQTFAAMQRIPGAASIPVLFLTALSGTSLKVKGLESGAEDYITKPFERTELLARIKAALRRSQRYQEAADTLRGRLDQISLPDVLQTLDIGGKSAIVSLPDIDGEIVVRSGLFVKARLKHFTHQAALLRILLLGRGSFSVQLIGAADAVPDAPSAGGAASDMGPIPLTVALMHALAEIDEVRQSMRRLGSESDLVRLTSDPSAWPALADLLPGFPMRLDELVAALPGSLGENIAFVGAFVAAKKLVLKA